MRLHRADDRSSSTDPPPVDGAAMEKAFRRDDAVPLEHRPILHDELHVAQGVSISSNGLPATAMMSAAKPALSGPRSWSMFETA